MSCPHFSIQPDGTPEPDIGFVPTYWCADCGKVFERAWDGELVETDEKVELI